MFGPTYISRFRSLTPAYLLAQDRTFEWLVAAHTQAESTAAGNQGAQFDETVFRERVGRALCRHGCDSSRIATRGVQLMDCTHTDWTNMSLYRLGQLPQGEAMLTRTRLFAKLARTALDRIYEGDTRPPSDMVHVTCTGYAAPSVAQTLVADRGWGRLTRVTHAYHMGCYASIPALHIASGFVAGGPCNPIQVDVVHTELCSLHLNPAVHTAEQLVIQTLFADGVIRYSVSREPIEAGESRLQVLALAQDTLADSSDAMQWVCADWGLQMTLAREVPTRLTKELGAFVERLCELAGQKQGECVAAYFAIHPGGPRILDLAQDLLRLRDEQLSHSREVLLQRGNMSSATLPHIWMKLLADRRILDGQTIISLAFGPGLTLCGAVLRKVIGA